MGFTVKHDMELREHCETQEEVDALLKSLNRGQLPFLVYTSGRGIKQYIDWTNNAIAVIPDPVEPTSEG